MAEIVQSVKNPREGTQGILEFVNEEETKELIVVIFSNGTREKTVEGWTNVMQ